MDQTEIQKLLDGFAKDPKAAMDRLPVKRDLQGQPVDSPVAFSPEDIENGRYITQRDTVRRTFSTTVDGNVVSLENILPGRAPIDSNNRPENLADLIQATTLAQMQSAGLTGARLAVQPWSDDYWPFYVGGLGRRYADPQFPLTRDWQFNLQYVLARPAAALIATGNPAVIDLLSPAEKYDLLVGDMNFGLTNTMWNEGRRYLEALGEVEVWMGICHGWAPASYMLPAPGHVITVVSGDGAIPLNFYPSDIKALASLLWANARTPMRLIGGRSNDREPLTDAVGRFISPDVFDTNPASFHVALVNQLGVAHRSLILDVTYDYEVWNQPVYAYEYTYFNPQVLRATGRLNEATVPIAAFTNDHFRSYRSQATAAVVGIAMRVIYVVETMPTHQTVERPNPVSLRQVDYLYDIELTTDGLILGGEWYQNRHPDFMWTPPPGARAVTPGDQYATGTWMPRGPLPAAWQRAAQQTSSYKMPLAKIVESLIALSRQA